MHLLQKILLAKRMLDEVSAKLRLMIAIANNEERIRRKFSGKVLEQVPIVAGRHSLATNVLIHVRRVAEVGSAFGTQPLVPGKMIGHCINVKE